MLSGIFLYVRVQLIMETLKQPKSLMKEKERESKKQKNKKAAVLVSV